MKLIYLCLAFYSVAPLVKSEELIDTLIKHDVILLVRTANDEVVISRIIKGEINRKVINEIDILTKSKMENDKIILLMFSFDQPNGNFLRMNFIINNMICDTIDSKLHCVSIADLEKSVHK